MQLHQEDLLHCAQTTHAPTRREVETLAKLVIGPDAQAASDFISRFERRGYGRDVLFSQLLEPAARHLGKMWEDDACDFLDVTLGVARLQELLAAFNAVQTVVAGDKRRVITAITPGEQHRFGLAVVEKILRTAGWEVRSEAGSEPEAVAAAVRSEWFAVAGFTLSCESGLGALAQMIKTIREQSLNKSIAVMVGGSLFATRPELAECVGADATAVNAPAAVFVAQKLFNLSLGGRAPASNLS